MKENATCIAERMMKQGGGTVGLPNFTSIAHTCLYGVYEIDIPSDDSVDVYEIDKVEECSSLGKYSFQVKTYCILSY